MAEISATPTVSSLVETELSIPVSFRLFADVPPGSNRDTPVVVALHGYAQDAAMIRDVARRLSPEGAILLAPEGPFSTLAPGTESEATKKVGFHWGVHPKAEWNRGVHRAAVDAAISWALRNCGDADRVSLVAFSQPCSFNYRLALDPPHGRPFRAIVGICGGLPGEWLAENAMPEGTSASKRTAVLHVSTKDDPFYPAGKIEPYGRHLAARFGSAEHRLYDGGHRIPSAAADVIRAVLAASATA
jgi:dienelactone hydrolase